MYKRLIRIATFFLIGLCAGAALPQAPAPAPPAISDALKAQFFKAQAQKIQADIAAQQKQQVFAQAVADLNKACGDGFEPQLNPAGDPACVAKPAPKPDAKEKK